jgi:hypothetical protein
MSVGDDGHEDTAGREDAADFVEKPIGMDDLKDLDAEHTAEHSRLCGKLPVFGRDEDAARGRKAAPTHVEHIVVHVGTRHGPSVPNETFRPSTAFAADVERDERATRDFETSRQQQRLDAREIAAPTRLSSDFRPRGFERLAPHMPPCA